MSDAVLPAKGRSDQQAEKERIEFLEKKIQSEDEVLAELMGEYVALKKELGELQTGSGCRTMCGVRSLEFVRLRSKMLDRDIVPVSPSSVWRTRLSQKTTILADTDHVSKDWAVPDSRDSTLPWKKDENQGYLSFSDATPY